MVLSNDCDPYKIEQICPEKMLECFNWHYKL